MASSWIQGPKLREIRGPFPHDVQLAGRFFNQARYDEQCKAREQQCTARQKADEEAALLHDDLMKKRREEFIAGTDRKYISGRLRDKVKARLKLHEFSLEDRRHKLRDLLFDEDEKYRHEAETMVPTTLDRLAENREQLKQLRDRKEKERLELVQQKYLQQAGLNNEELRRHFQKWLELEADADRKAQLRLKRDIAERQKVEDQHYHDLIVADVAARARREELDTIARNRSNHVQAQALVEQIASLENSRAAQTSRIAEEHQYLMEQRELRRKEEQAELERKYRNQKATREMYEQSIKLAKQKRDKAQHEEMVCDMKQLEEVMKGITDETLAIQQRKKQLHKEQMQYLDYLNTARELDKQKEAEIERLVLEDQQQQNDKWLRREKLNAAARRRLFCDVRAVQQQQRQEKAKKTLVTREDRERNRQVLLGEIEAACQAEHEDRRREAQKKLDCRSDLLGQIEYNKRRKREAGQEEARLVDKQNDAEKLFQEELKYLLANPTTLKWNQRRKTLPDEHKISCSEPH